MQDVFSIIVGIAAAVAPAYIAMFSSVDKLDKLRDECRTLREQLANLLTYNKNCHNIETVREALSSTPCEQLDIARDTSIKAIAATFALTGYFIVLGITERALLGFILAIITPYTVLWGFVSRDLAGILASARSIVSSQCMVNPHPNRK